MVSGSELEALRIVAEVGGETVAGVVSRRMRISTEYARLLLNSLARTDYLDRLASGRYRITGKGESALESKGMRIREATENGRQGGIWRWLKRSKKQKKAKTLTWKSAV